MPEIAVQRIAKETKAMLPFVEDAKRNLARPLWQQFAKISAGRTVKEGREAARLFLGYLDKVEEQQCQKNTTKS